MRARDRATVAAITPAQHIRNLAEYLRSHARSVQLPEYGTEYRELRTRCAAYCELAAYCLEQIAADLGKDKVAPTVMTNEQLILPFPKSYFS